MKQRPAPVPAGPDPQEPGPSTRDALMDAALAQLAGKGVLAGLNLREVADAVGVTPANIYHYFGSRQGLLRAALQRATAQLAAPMAASASAAFVERRLAMFDVISRTPELVYTALLAIDRDPSFELMPFLEATRASYRRQMDEGAIPADLDIEAAHLTSLAISIGFGIYSEVAARQLGVTVDELHARMRAAFERMLRGLVEAPAEPRK
jgi:AcrR family transcriptional regulator